MSNTKFTEVGLETAKCFGKNQENRVISHSHVQKLKREMLKSFDLFPPITVNRKTNNIIDGQHRTKSYIELMTEELLPEDAKLRVMYVEVEPDKEIDVICDANQNSKNWGVDDFIARYVKNGKSSYVALEDWCKSHSLCMEKKKDKVIPKYRYASAIIKGKGCSDDLKKGVFTIADEELSQANIIHAEMLEIINVLNIKDQGSWIEALAVSWGKYRDLHSYKDWMKQLKDKKKRLIKMPKDNQKDWDNIFKEINSVLDLELVKKVKEAA